MDRTDNAMSFMSSMSNEYTNESDNEDNLVGNSAGTAPLAGGSGIGISAYPGIPQNYGGKLGISNFEIPKNYRNWYYLYVLLLCSLSAVTSTMAMQLNTPLSLFPPSPPCFLMSTRGCYCIHPPLSDVFLFIDVGTSGLT